MTRKPFMLITIIICTAAIIAVRYKINLNIKKDIYPKGNFVNAFINDNTLNYKDIKISQNQVDTIVKMLIGSDKSIDTHPDISRKYRVIHLNFEGSAASFYIDDNTKNLYYIIQKRGHNGEGHAVYSKALLDYLEDIYNYNT